MLANSEEKLARDKRFEEWQKRDKKVQQLANQPPTYFIQSLSDLNISMADMNSLRALLDSAPLPWIYQFIDCGGINHLSKMLEFLIYKKYAHFSPSRRLAPSHPLSIAKLAITQAS